MHAYTRAYADCRRSCLYFCSRLRRAYTPTVAVKVQTCWTFKASADQRRHSSQSWKRSKVTEGRRVVLHRDVCRRIPTHTLACLYFYPRRNLRYAVATHRQPQAWTSAPAAGAYARMEYKPGFILYKNLDVFHSRNYSSKFYAGSLPSCCRKGYVQDEYLGFWMTEYKQCSILLKYINNICLDSNCTDDLHVLMNFFHSWDRYQHGCIGWMY